MKIELNLLRELLLAIEVEEYLIDGQKIDICNPSASNQYPKIEMHLNYLFDAYFICDVTKYRLTQKAFQILGAIRDREIWEKAIAKSTLKGNVVLPFGTICQVCLSVAEDKLKLNDNLGDTKEGEIQSEG